MKLSEYSDEELLKEYLDKAEKGAQSTITAILIEIELKVRGVDVSNIRTDYPEYFI